MVVYAAFQMGTHVENSYAKSLAQFGAILGPKAWRFVALEMQKVLAPGVPFGPGWVGEQEAPLQVKKQHAAESTATASPSNKSGAGSLAASTVQVTTVQAPARFVVSPAAPSHSSSSAAASCASPGNSSAVPLKVTSQAGVDSPPYGKTGQEYLMEL